MNFRAKSLEGVSAASDVEDRPQCDVCFRNDCFHANPTQLFSSDEVLGRISQKFGASAQWYFCESVWDWVEPARQQEAKR